MGGMATVIDYSARQIPASAIRAAGHIGAVRYISPPRESWMKGKPASVQESQDFTSQALDMAFVWQYGGASNPDSMRGRAGGLADAQAADAQLKAIKRTGYPVFFAVDFNITLQQWNSTAVKYFKAACEVLGRERVGIYGHSRVCDWAREDGVIGSAGNGRFLQWQTTAWSQGAISPHAVIIQNRHNVPGPSGVTVDVNDVLHKYWGQHPPRAEQAAGTPITDPSPAPSNVPPELRIPPLITSQFKCDNDMLTWRDNGVSRRARRAICLHTDESAYNYATGKMRSTAWTADQLAAYNRRRDVSGGSYHIGVDRAGSTTRQNDDVYGVWAVGSVGNDEMFHICMTGTAYLDRAGWEKQEKQLNKVAQVLAHYCRYHKIPPVRISPADLKAGRKGILGHWDCSKYYGGSTHWDPGGYDGSTGVPRTSGGFPWEKVIAKTKAILDAQDTPKPAPAPAPAPAVTPGVTNQSKEKKEGADVLSEKLQSIINPKVFLTVRDILRLADGYLWEFKVVLKAIAAKVGVDYEQVVAEAVKKDRGE